MRLPTLPLRTDGIIMAAQPAHTAMSTAKDIYDEVKALPEPDARAVLNFVVRLKAMRRVSDGARRDAALATLKKYRGRFAAVKTQRDEFYDRKSVR